MNNARTEECSSKIYTSISATSSRYEATILPERLCSINCYSYILLLIHWNVWYLLSSVKNCYIYWIRNPA